MTDGLHSSNLNPNLLMSVYTCVSGEDCD